MDPMLPAILNVLAPALMGLVVFACPVGIIWIVKNHQFRMKELELEAQRLSPGVEQRLSAIEARLAAIEAAVAPPALKSPLQERVELLEAPATGPLPAQLRQR